MATPRSTQVDPTDEEGALHPASLRFASLATGVSFWNRTTTACDGSFGASEA